MENTLKLFNSIKTYELNNLQMEQLSEAYVEGLNPSILATAFSKCYKLIISISKKYYGLTSHDIASFSVEVLDFCLQSYVPGKASFTTYFSKVLSNRFRQETESLSTAKRKVVFHSSSLEAIIEEGFEPEDIHTKVSTLDDIIDCLLDFDLNPRELEYCTLLLADYKNSEIAEMLEVSVMTLSNIRKRLRRKMLPLYLDFA